MQTIASLAKRLEMTADEALVTLQRLHYSVESVDSEISDEQSDILMDVDEDPEVLNRLLQDILKREEQARKRNERLQKAAKKAAAEKAAKKAEAEKKAADKKKKTDTDEDEEPLETLEAEAEEAAEEKEEDGDEAAEEQFEPVMEEEAASVQPPVTAKPKVVAEILEEAPKPVAEILPPAPPEPPAPPKKKAPKPEVQKKKEAPSIIIGAAAEIEEPAVELVLADGTHAHAADIVVEDPETVASEEESEIGVLAEAERQQEEEERRRAKRGGKPLPVPDPDVVAEVIRKAHERSQKKVAKDQIARGEVIDKDLLFRGEAPKVATGKTAKKRQKRAEKARAIEESLRRDAAAAVREFEAGWGLGPAKKRRRKRTREEVSVEEEAVGGVIEVTEGMTLEALADALDVSVSDMILELMDENILATKNQTLDLELIQKIAANHGFEVRAIIPEEQELLSEEPDNPEDLALRAPVVTVMGHVDHGKTSLLDVVRTANVAAGEAGGITQHIAAYEVEMPQGRVVFLDTPGHEAFTQMRARGAQVTDVVVLVVAADDGVKPQTIEAIDHAKAADVPIVVAINKCDKADAQPDRVRQELTQYGLVDEAWGGKTIMRNISAKTRTGVDELMELLVLEAQMLELKANPHKRARGAVVESEISRGQGPVAWVLVQNGTLRVGDVFLAGQTSGRVRTMTSSRGEPLEEVGPSTPVLVTGFDAPADAGDIFMVVADERVARAVAEKRAALNRQKRGPAAKRMTLEDFHARMLGGEQKSLNIIIKADVQGSVDVLESSFAKLGNEEVKVELVHSGVGGINESDVLLASASNAVILGFHVTANPKAQKAAEQEGVEIRTYLVIYEAIDDVRHALEGLLTPDIKEVITGHAEVRQVFRSSAIGNIAGCFQLDGESQRSSKARLIRDGVIVHDGRIGSVRRAKDDVRVVVAGFECGIKMDRYDDIQVGDVIESYREEQVAKTLN